MIVTWMLYASAIALCFTLAAIAAEWVLRAFRLPARGVWVLALLGSLVLPVLALVPNDRPIAVAQPSPSAWAELLPIPGPIAATRWTASWGPQANASVLVLWGVATVLLIGVLVGGTVRLARERRRWRTAKIGGEAVMISPATGPGVVGVLQSNIVVPEWVCALEQELQNLIVSHEQEHRRAHDLLLVFLGLAAVVVFPWNAALWWQLRRIKLAIEIDCDRRVLGRGTSLRAYAELLVASAEYQVTRLQPGAMALADSRSQLERRIEDMTRSNVRSRGPRTVVHAVAAIALVAVACDTPLPEAPELSKQELDQNDEAEGLLFVHRDSTKVKVFIRADQSQTAHTEKPLYVVDGVILSGDFAKLAIEKADIESIEVVKGAAAEELYGTRAANGVIHIVTKDGAVEPVVDLLRIKERPDSGN